MVDSDVAMRGHPIRAAGDLVDRPVDLDGLVAKLWRGISVRLLRRKQNDRNGKAGTGKSVGHEFGSSSNVPGAARTWQGQRSRSLRSCVCGRK
jgi:hypothetical protein